MSSSISLRRSPDLPDSVIQSILARIACDGRRGLQTLASLCLVCKKWRDEFIIGDEMLWRTMATSLNADCFPPHHELPSRLLFSCHRLETKPSWRAVCELYFGWSKAFKANPRRQLPQIVPQPIVSKTFCKEVLPPVPDNCCRVFFFAIERPQALSNFLVMQRHTSDLPHLQQRLITASDFCRRWFTILSADGQPPCFTDLNVSNLLNNNAEEPYYMAHNALNLFSKLDSQNSCEALNGVLHRRRVDRSCLQKFFGNEGEARTGGECPHLVYLVHNMLGDLKTADIWAMPADDDTVCCSTFWRKNLVYATRQRHLEIMRPETYTTKCIKSGRIDGERWSIEVTDYPGLLDVNSRYAAVACQSQDRQTAVMVLLLNIKTGQQVQMIDLRPESESTSSCAVVCVEVQNIVLTDGILIMNVAEGVAERGRLHIKHDIRLYNLPNLDPLYNLEPFPQNCSQEPEVRYSIALSICGRYLGVSSSLGHLVIYDMLVGSIRYSGSTADYRHASFPHQSLEQSDGDIAARNLSATNRNDGTCSAAEYKVQDGVWLWYKVVSKKREEYDYKDVLEDGIFYWQLKPPYSHHDFMTYLRGSSSGN